MLRRGIFCLLLLPVLFATDQGEANFNQFCKACHTVNGGRLVGPDLAGISQKRDQSWLIEFVKGSQAMVKRGDKDAVAIYKEYSPIPMPDQPLNDRQIIEVLAFIDRAAGQSTANATQPLAPARVATQDDLDRGKKYFQGLLRFEEKGPSCLACHHVNTDAVIGGGSLARDLTNVFSRLGAPGLKSILASSPFPVMEQAYKDQGLNDDEIFALVAFLQQADKDHASQKPHHGGLKLFGSGLAGVAMLFLGYSVMWRRRKKHHVHQLIFDRQIPSE